MRSLPVAQQFLTKPCDAETLRGVLERACRLHDLVSDDELKRLAGTVETLPALPRVYTELTAAMGRPTTTAKELAGIVKQDPAMLAKLLQLVNSAYFGRARRVTTADEAVVFLGVDLIRTIALTAHVFTSVEAMRGGTLSLEALQQRAILTAKVARRILGSSTLAAEAFTAGALHDIGILLLALRAPKHLAAVQAVSQKHALTMVQAERELGRVGHAEIGGYLLGIWGLPMSIVEGVAYHHDPRAAGEAELGIVGAVHVADALVEKQTGSLQGRESSGIDAAYLESVGQQNSVKDWAAIAAEEAAGSR
jgi:HD-like signal output (HDOD) protein